MTDLTIEDALSMLKSGDASVLAIDRCDERRKISVKHSTEFHNFLIRTLEEHARAMKDAARYKWIRDRTSGEQSHRGHIKQQFALPDIPPIADLMRGSVAQHLDAAIDAQITKEQA